MLANEPTSERAVSIMTVLAALAFAALTIALCSSPLGRAGGTTRPEPGIDGAFVRRWRRVCRTRRST